MKIRVICSKEELEKTDEIQEALDRAMKPLTDMGFSGEISIEEAQINKPSKQGKLEAITPNLKDNIPLLTLSTLATNAGFGLEHWLHKEYEDAKPLLQSGVYFCAILDLGEDYEHATHANMGACEAVKLLSKTLNPTKLKEFISEAREIKPELLRLIEGTFSDAEHANSGEHIRKRQRFFNEASAPFLRMVGGVCLSRRRLP